MRKKSKSITQQPNAIERVFCVPFSKLEHHKLDDDMMRSFISVYMIPEDAPEAFEIAETFIIKLGRARLNGCFTFEICDWRLWVLLAMITDGVAGQIVMYLTYLQWWCKENDQRILTLDDISRRIFPLGLPSKEDLHDLWNKQKVKDYGNLLDHYTAAESIQFKPEKETA